MNKPVTVFVDSAKAVARLSGPLVLGDSYAVAFSGLSTEESASAPEMIVLGPKPGEIAARSGEDAVLAMTTRPCVEAFGPLPPPPLPRPKQFPHPPPLPNPPVHWRGGPHGSTRMHFYVVAGGQTLAQGDLVLLWAPFEFDEAGEPIQLRGEKGDPGEKGEKGDQGVAGRNGVYVAMDGLYAFHISQGGDHPEDGHLWLHAQDESTLYAHDANGNYLLDENGERIPLYYVGNDGHLRYRFFFQDSTHVELDLGKVVTREGLYAFHVSDGSDGEPAGHLMLHGQDLSQLYARDGQGNLILDGDGNPIPLFHIDSNGHLHFTFYGNDGQAHESLDLGDVRGPALTWADLTPEQKAELKGEKGDEGDKGDKGDPLTWDDLTDEQKASLKGAKGDAGENGMDAEEIVALVEDTMGEADDAPTAGSRNWVTSGGLWSVEQAILARIMALATQINAIASKTGGALHFKGSVQSASDLPEDGNEPGDTYDVIDEGGVNYAWTGSEWNALGATIDLSAYRTAAAQDAIDAGKLNATGLTNNNGQLGALDFVTRYSFGFEGGKYITAPENSGAALTDNDIADSSSALGGALAAKANSSALAAVATTGDYADLNNKPTIPSAYGPFTAREEAVASQTREQTSYGKGGAATSDGNGNTWSSALPKNSGTLALQEGIAPAFSSSSTYAVGSYCTHEGLLYKCTTAVTTAGAWDAANWSAVAVVDEMGADTPLPFDAEVEYIECSGVSTYLDFYVNSLYDLELEVYLPNGTISADTAMLGRWTNSHSHLISAANSKFNVYYGGTSTTSINNAPPTGSWFTMGLQGSVASCNGQTTSVTRKYDTDGASKMMIVATNNARIRRARISYGAHDLMDLRPVRVGSTAYFYDSVRGILVSIDYGTATPGPDKATPTITTPGRIVELTPAIRYSFASTTPSVSGTAATVACEDRAINDFTVATGITSLTITPPAAVTGRARDFFCRVTLTDSSLPTVTLSGGTIDIGSTEVAGMTQGVNLLMFTEIASGHWLASRRSAS